MDIRDLSKTAGAVKPVGSQVEPPKRRWLTRVLLPALIMLLTGGLLAYAARDALWPVKPVRVVRVVATEGDRTGDAPAETAATTVSVLAPGWVEPDPYTTYVTALTSGIIKKILVLEGQPVHAGQVVAEMVDDDARLAVVQANAVLARCKALLQAAQLDWDNPVALERAVAVNQHLLAKATAERAQLGAAIAQQKAKFNELETKHDRLSSLLPNGAAKLEVEQAKYRVDAQLAQVKATKMQQPVFEATIRRYEAEIKAAETDLRLRVAPRRSLDEAHAYVQEAQAALDKARLQQERMKVVSPVAGIVMRRLVAPGAKVMLQMDDPHSAHVVHVYSAKNLQVRVDVPLGDASKVVVGQKARIVVNVLPNHEFAGHVTRFGHQADIGKNTVEVKVAIEDPSPLLKPDMLARVKFLSQSLGHAASAAASALTVYAPRQTLQWDGDDAHVWVVTPGQARLLRQPVKLGAQRGDGWVAVIDGLQPGDVLVARPAADLRQGQRVAVVGEEEPDG